MLDQSWAVIFATPSGQAGVGLGAAVRMERTMRVGLTVPIVGEGVTVNGTGVLAGAVLEGVGACPPQAVASVRIITSAKAISQTLRVLKTLRVF